VVGRINPEYFLGGSLHVDVERARAAIATIAEPLGVSIEDAALGIIRIANANMVHLLKLVSVRQGRDPREFVMVAFGGGGSMHAASLAKELHIPRVIVPPNPGHFSAWGMLMSDLRHDLVQTRIARLEQLQMSELTTAYEELEQRLQEVFVDEGISAGEIHFTRTADMRYLGQEHTVNVPLPGGDFIDEQRTQIADSFHALHERLYTFRQDSPIEIVNLHVTGFGLVRKPELQRIASHKDISKAFKGTRMVDFDDLGHREAKIYERGLLGAGAELEGPSVIEEAAASTLVLPGQHLHIDNYGSIIIQTGH
jgi:N-methylhydantoinase A